MHIHSHDIQIVLIDLPDLFSSQQADDLSFPAGATIDIIEETNADWWKGRYNGREGIFPSSYVEKLPSSSAHPAPALGFPHAAASLISSSPDPEKSSMYGNAGGGPRFTAPPPRNGGYMPPPPQPNQWGPPSPQPPPPWAQGGPGPQGPPPPQAGYFYPPPPPPGVAVEPDKKKNKFGKYGSQAASSAASGVGFGAGEFPFALAIVWRMLLMFLPRRCDWKWNSECHLLIDAHVILVDLSMYLDDIFVIVRTTHCIIYVFLFVLFQ